MSFGGDPEEEEEIEEIVEAFLKTREEQA